MAIVTATIVIEEEWIEFLMGEWQLELPKLPGRYKRASLDGLEIQEGTIYQCPILKIIKSDYPWNGYWWSKPTPWLPPPNIF